jgi:molecular chaperone GrpE (heat shock protein)
MENSRIDDDIEQYEEDKENQSYAELSKEIETLFEQTKQERPDAEKEYLFSVFFQKISLLDDENLTHAIDEFVNQLEETSDIYKVLENTVA